MAKRKTTEENSVPLRRPGRKRAPRPAGLAGQLGTELERRRETKGWSSADLADAARIGLGTVIRVEGGRTSPTLETVLALAHALGISGQELLAPCPDWTIIPQKKG
jgi:ribosome-binding protein aMBF1 (putative translation factor)